MTEFLPTLLLAALVVLVFAAMWLGWHRRTRRAADLPVAHAAPEDPGTVLCEAVAQHVATTRHDEPLERLAIAGLAFRGTAHVRVAAAGILVRIRGELDVFIPSDALVSVARSSWTIDKAVERDGLVAVSWRVDDEGLVADSYFRIADPVERDRLIASMERVRGACGSAAGKEAQ